jgi:hypothetical protein
MTDNLPSRYVALIVLQELDRSIGAPLNMNRLGDLDRLWTQMTETEQAEVERVLAATTP